jgi:tRNA 2-selenouridine synthase
MTHHKSYRVEDRHTFDVVIDARSPSEFALDHIPGAINCPVLNDEERRIVGTLYKQVGPFEARRVGGAMVAANLAIHLREKFADKPPKWRPLVYCWRGGLRSGSMVNWLRLVGWDAQQLAGGYKTYRHHVLAQLRALCPQLMLQVVVGATGSAKTRVLHALAQRGAQVVDLEALACHKGSLLGGIPGVHQPTQKHFDTLLCTQLEGLDLQRVVYVEGESARIGKVALPQLLVDTMRRASCIEVVASPDTRLEFLLRDYAYLGDDPQGLCTQLDRLKVMQGKETVARWQAWAMDGNLSELFAQLMAMHYDPLYIRSQTAHFAQWDQRLRVDASSLTPSGVDAVADAILAST